MGAGLKKDLRVSRVGPGGALNAFFFHLIRVISQRLARVRKKGGTSILGERSTPESYMVRSLVQVQDGPATLGKRIEEESNYFIHAPLSSGGYRSVGRALLFIGEEDQNVPLKGSIETKMGCQECKGESVGGGGGLPCGGCQRFESAYLQLVNLADTKLYDCTQFFRFSGSIYDLSFIDVDKIHPFSSTLGWHSLKSEGQGVKHYFSAGRESGTKLRQTLNTRYGLKIKKEGSKSASETIGDKLHRRERNSPDHQLRPLNGRSMIKEVGVRRQPGGSSTEGESRPKIRPKGIVDGQQGLTPAQCRKVKEVGDLIIGEPTTEAPVNGDYNYNGPKDSQKVMEAYKGFLGPDGDWPSSTKVEGSLTARPTRRAGMKVGLSDPTVPSGNAVAQ
ncbi:hypothetical protein FXO37_32330 [Capsicum annuum]|nr:hypothetical protein FXO37_32330 [Capsicum annuum]